MILLIFFFLLFVIKQLKNYSPTAMFCGIHCLYALKKSPQTRKILDEKGFITLMMINSFSLNCLKLYYACF